MIRPARRLPDHWPLPGLKPHDVLHWVETVWALTDGATPPSSFQTFLMSLLVGSAAHEGIPPGEMLRQFDRGPDWVGWLASSILASTDAPGEHLHRALRMFRRSQRSAHICRDWRRRLARVLSTPRLRALALTRAAALAAQPAKPHSEMSEDELWCWLVDALSHFCRHADEPVTTTLKRMRWALPILCELLWQLREHPRPLQAALARLAGPPERLLPDPDAAPPVRDTLATLLRRDTAEATFRAWRALLAWRIEQPA
jgi:hypothetical protein